MKARMTPRAAALPSRRRVLLLTAVAGAGAAAGLPVGTVRAQTPAASAGGATGATPGALPDALSSAVAGFTGGAPHTPGRVHMDIATLVDNGNAVPLTVSVDSPMTPADHVTAIAVFNERNPQREVIQAAFSPRSGKAALSTRIRLATTQKLVAVARMSDGSFWSQTVDVVVTLAACIEES